MEERLHGGNQISDKFVVVDFERAIHNALLEIFPDATLYGCVWHFKHSLTQKVAKLAIKRLYNQSKEFKKLVSMIGALVWCPPADIPGNWTAVKNYCAGKLYAVPGLPNDQCFPVWAPFTEGIRQFLTYFEETWVGDAFAGTDPLFSPTMWSGYRTLMDRTLPSTQGGSEAYNYAFRRLVFT